MIKNFQIKQISPPLKNLLIAFLILGCSHSKEIQKPRPNIHKTKTCIAEVKKTITKSPALDITITYPSISLNKETNGIIPVLHSFNFRGKTYTISLNLQKQVVTGARNSIKQVVTSQKKLPTDWKNDFHASFIFDTAQDQFFKDLLNWFNTQKRKQNFDYDSFAEFITAAVQSIEYDTQEGSPPKFPIETFADLKGDCDDKSKLLAGVLTRLGFDVATLHFSKESHMAVGIKSDDFTYPCTSYIYIETTSPSMMGFPFKEEANVQLKSTPEVYPIGKGTIAYTSGHQVQIIKDTFYSSKEKISALQKEIEKLKSNIIAIEKELNTQEQKIAAQKKNNKINQQDIDKYNLAVQNYNLAAEAKNQLVNEINKIISVFNFISENKDNRFDAYKFIKNNSPK